jgi:uncharacterized OB-fold protein
MYRVRLRESETKLTKAHKEIMSICKECGRMGHIPKAYCNICWKDMFETFN